MRFAVLRHDSRTVNRQHNMVVHQGGIIYQLVIGALQKSGIYRKNRQHTARREGGSEGHRVGLGDTDIKTVGRTAGCEPGHAGARLHSRRNPEDAVIFSSKRVKSFTEYRRKARLGYRFQRFGGVKVRNAVINIGTLFCKGISLSFHRFHMHNNRSFQ